MLRDSVGDRRTMQQGLDGVTSCGDIGTGLARLRRAAAQRKAAVDRVAALDVSHLPAGPELKRHLTAALSYSLAADQSLVAWGGERQHRKCAASSLNTAASRAATKSSQAATKEKLRVAALWAPLAREFDLPSYSANQL